jgi:hypothetical protein
MESQNAISSETYAPIPKKGHGQMKAVHNAKGLSARTKEMGQN